MPQVVEYVVTWTGGRIGSGATVFHLNAGGGAVDWAAVNTAIGGWFTAIRPSIPNDVTWVFPFEVRSLDVETGALVTAVSIPQRASISGSDASTTWSAPTGRIVKWSTGAVVAGRRLTGHTYLVPSSPSAFAEGSINTTVVLSDATAHAALITALAATTAPLAVWSRTHGQVGVVQGGATLSRPTVLRSRND